MIRQGDLYWLDLEEPFGSEPGYRRPHVVIQNNVFNAGRIKTTLVCGLTTNLRHASAPGNILLEPGEGGLPEQSIVNVSQVVTVNKAELEEKIGQLSARRVRQILNGIKLLIEPREPADNN